MAENADLLVEVREAARRAKNRLVCCGWAGVEADECVDPVVAAAERAVGVARRAAFEEAARDFDARSKGLPDDSVPIITWEQAAEELREMRRRSELTSDMFKVWPPQSPDWKGCCCGRCRFLLPLG